MSIKIKWIRAFNDGEEKKYGGRAYNNFTYSVLKDNFDFSFYDVFQKNDINYFKLLINSFIKCLNINENADIWIRDYFTTIPILFNKPLKNNVIFVQHIASTSQNLIVKTFFYIYNLFFYRAILKSDAVITISNFWKNHFLKKGVKNVYVVYPFLEFEKMNINDKDVVNFRTKYNLLNRPIIYLGNCREYKGVKEAYEILKNLDVILITSGTKEIEIPAINLDLSYFEYLCLLKASSIVLFMSKFEEGWGLTAHEAMYLGTPVIGSGLGGNRELLEAGGQIISNFENLYSKVLVLLNDEVLAKDLSIKGHNFAKKFTKEEFKKSWINTIKNISS